MMEKDLRHLLASGPAKGAAVVRPMMARWQRWGRKTWKGRW